MTHQGQLGRARARLHQPQIDKEKKEMKRLSREEIGYLRATPSFTGVGRAAHDLSSPSFRTSTFTMQCYAQVSRTSGQQEDLEKELTSACDRLLCRTRHCFFLTEPCWRCRILNSKDAAICAAGVQPFVSPAVQLAWRDAHLAAQTPERFCEICMQAPQRTKYSKRGSICENSTFQAFSSFQLHGVQPKKKL